MRYVKLLKNVFVQRDLVHLGIRDSWKHSEEIVMLKIGSIIKLNAIKETNTSSLRTYAITGVSSSGVRFGFSVSDHTFYLKSIFEWLEKEDAETQFSIQALGEI